MRYTGQARTYVVPGICPRGGGTEICRGPRITPLQNQRLVEFGTLFLGEAQFYERKKSTKFEKRLIWGPTKIATGDPVTYNFEPHGLQRSPKGPYAHHLGSYVAQGAHGIQRSCIGP